MIVTTQDDKVPVPALHYVRLWPPESVKRGVRVILYHSRSKILTNMCHINIKMLLWRIYILILTIPIHTGATPINHYHTCHPPVLHQLLLTTYAIHRCYTNYSLPHMPYTGATPITPYHICHRPVLHQLLITTHAMYWCNINYCTHCHICNMLVRHQLHVLTNTPAYKEYVR